MARKKIVLQHVTFGDCKVLDAYYTTDSNSAYFKVECDAGIKQLLADPQYWISDKAELRTAFDAFSNRKQAATKAKAAIKSAALRKSKKKAKDVEETLSSDSDDSQDLENDNDAEDLGTGIDDARSEHESESDELADAYAAGEW
jgi:hypothetical protein